MKKQMTVLTMVRSMFNGIICKPSEKEYELLRIPKYRIFRRKHFSNVYMTLVLYLTKLSIPKAFPKEATKILDVFDKMYNIAYKKQEILKKDIENDSQIFQKLTNFSLEDPFIYVAKNIVERFEKRPRNVLFMSMLNDRINSLFASFIRIGEQVEIIASQEDEEIINKILKK